MFGARSCPLPSCNVLVRQSLLPQLHMTPSCFQSTFNAQRCSTRDPFDRPEPTGVGPNHVSPPTVHIIRGWGGHTVYYGGPAGSLLFGSIPIPPPTPSTSGQTEKLQESVKDEENLFDDTELRLYRQRQQMERHAQSAWEDAQRLAEHSARVEEAKKLQVVKERKGHRWRE